MRWHLRQEEEETFVVENTQRGAQSVENSRAASESWQGDAQRDQIILHLIHMHVSVKVLHFVYLHRVWGCEHSWEEGEQKA